jgi:hypothetical protein
VFEDLWHCEKYMKLNCDYQNEVTTEQSVAADGMKSRS